MILKPICLEWPHIHHHSFADPIVLMECEEWCEALGDCYGASEDHLAGLSHYSLFFTQAVYFSSSASNETCISPLFWYLYYLSPTIPSYFGFMGYSTDGILQDQTLMCTSWMILQTVRMLFKISLNAVFMTALQIMVTALYLRRIYDLFLMVSLLLADLGFRLVDRDGLFSIHSLHHPWWKFTVNLDYSQTYQAFAVWL